MCLLFCKSASSLARTASRLDQANRNYHSAVFSASSHLNRKPTLGSFVPDFEFSSATETKKCSSNIDSLLQLAIDSEKKATTEGKQQVDQTKNNVENPRSEYTFKIENSAHKHGVVLTREYWDELVEVVGYINSFTTGKDRTYLHVTIDDGESYLKFECFGTSDAISIQRIGITNTKYSEDYCPYDYDKEMEYDDMDENLKKVFFEYLEIRGIKPSMVDFMIKCYRYKKGKKKKSMGLKKIKNFIEQLS